MIDEVITQLIYVVIWSIGIIFTVSAVLYMVKRTFLGTSLRFSRVILDNETAERGTNEKTE